MALLEAIVRNTVYDLTNGPIIWTGDDNTGLVEVERITERGAQQDGDTDEGFTVQPRILQLALESLPVTSTEMWNERRRILRIFRPSTTPITLRWTLDNGEVLCIDGHVVGGISFGSSDREGMAQAFVVQLRCADPFFYNPTRKFVSAGVAASGTPFGFPVSFPEEFGIASTIDVISQLTYLGTWREYPVIEIVGPITNCVIEHLDTGDKLDFTGTTIGAGVTYTIDLRYGYKTIFDSSGINRIGQLTNDSDLATWSLQPDPEVADGINNIQFSGSGATSATQIYIRFYERHVGL